MSLVLSMVRCPDSVIPSDKEVKGVEFSIGRGSDNDWILPDPDRRLSRHHCKLLFQAGQWQLFDLSTHGTFLNNAATRISESQPCRLQNGDRISLGPYEIGVTLEETRQQETHQKREEHAAERTIPPDFIRPDFIGNDPFGAIEDTTGSHRGPVGVLTLHEQISEPFSGQIPDLHQALKPRQLISDDWDAPPNEPNDSAKNYVDLQRNPPLLEPHTARRGAADGAEDSLVAAFLAGVAMEDAALRDPRETLKRAGAALRATVSGLRAALIALDLIRGEFRIERTEIQASGNNPLKFSTSDDDTIAGFLGAGRNTMSPADAISKTLRSVRQHELATMTAMQSAAAALLAQFDPATLLRQTEQAGFAVLPGQHKVRAWDAFATAHARVSQSLSDNFDSVFARAFARAYEQTIDELSAQQDPP